jgi:hypothetical protein
MGDCRPRYLERSRNKTISCGEIEGTFSPVLNRGAAIAQMVQRRSRCWMAGFDSQQSTFSLSSPQRPDLLQDLPSLPRKEDLLMRRLRVSGGICHTIAAGRCNLLRSDMQWRRCGPSLASNPSASGQQYIRLLEILYQERRTEFANKKSSRTAGKKYRPTCPVLSANLTGLRSLFRG